MAKIITVVGATGTQGSSVISVLLNSKVYTIRAITRNPSSAAAQTLTAKGIEVVQADLNDIASLRAAFTGTHAIFAVTNFFEPLLTHGSTAHAAEVEATQGINMAIAAAATPTLEHYIWSTLPDSATNSAGQAVVPYYASKNRVDAYIRSRLPDLLKRTTFLWLAWFAGNMLTLPLYTPTRIRTLDGNAKSFVQFLSIDPGTPIPLLGDEKTNAGLFVRDILTKPHLTRDGKIVSTVLEYRSMADVVAAFAASQGVTVRCLRLGEEDYKGLWPVWGEVFDVSHRYFEVMGSRAFTAAPGDGEGGEVTVLTKEDLGVEGLVGVEEAFAKLGQMEWA
ncbi:hypothetical protein BJX64DRAFT_166419 [Aspergillus heterothallicus]